MVRCILCEQKHGRKEGLLHVINKEDTRLHTWHIDLLGPLPSTNNQYRRINRINIPIFTNQSIEEPSKWFKYIDRVQRSTNSTYQRSMGNKSIQIIHWCINESTGKFTIN